MTSLLVWIPLVGGLAACLLPRRAVGWGATVASLGALGVAIAMTAGFDPAGGMQYVVDEPWIPALGINYQLGVDGIAIVCVLVTAAVWPAATAWSAMTTPDRPRTWFAMLAVAQTGALGAFCAEDLLLFVLFFDLMLIPFFFLFGSWGEDVEGGPTAAQATIKMVIYTLVGSLLMLVGAIAAASIATNGEGFTFSLQAIQERGIPEGSQGWLFAFFAAAFLVKMPVFPLHGWMRDAYRTAPLPALALFSAVLSKVGAYGFLRVSLPLFPDASAAAQEALLIVAVVSIVYGSLMAFSQDDARLVVAFSSLAQLGFILLGIFSLRVDGGDGAVMQIVNHALVSVPLLLIVAFLAGRVGSSDLGRMGGLALRAPVLATLFLIVTMALLALPGSANFIGELFVLRGAFEANVAIAVVASSGIAMAGYYGLRLFQRSMHNRGSDPEASAEVPLGRGLILSGLVVAILALALYPGFIPERTTDSVAAQTAAARDVGAGAVSAQGDGAP